MSWGIEKRKNAKKGYTLVELMVVIAIMVILASAGSGIFRGYVDRARNAKAYEKAHLILQALKIVEAEYGGEGGMEADVLTNEAFFKAPNQPSSVLYPYVGGDTEDCIKYHIRFHRTEEGKYRISGFTYETEEYILIWREPSEITVERKRE